MRFQRTEKEKELLSLYKEMVEDIKEIKKRLSTPNHTAKDQHNKEELKNKINIVQNYLNRYRSDRTGREYPVIKVPYTKELKKFEQRVQDISEGKIKFTQQRRTVDSHNIVILMTKEDIEEGRLTKKTLKKLLVDFYSDDSWDKEDIKDTIKKVKKGKIVGIGFVPYDSEIEELFSEYILGTNENLNGEFIDVKEKHLSIFEDYKKVHISKLI